MEDQILRNKTYLWNAFCWKSMIERDRSQRNTTYIWSLFGPYQHAFHWSLDLDACGNSQRSVQHTVQISPDMTSSLSRKGQDSNEGFCDSVIHVLAVNDWLSGITRSNRDLERITAGNPMLSINLCSFASCEPRCDRNQHSISLGTICRHVSKKKEKWRRKTWRILTDCPKDQVVFFQDTSVMSQSLRSNIHLHISTGIIHNNRFYFLWFCGYNP